MKHLILAAAGAMALATGAMADPVLGTWQTPKDDNGKYGYVDVKACGAAVCGTLVKSFNADGSAYASENVGKRIIWDMEPKGGGAYSGGKVWAPDRDKTYNAKMQLSGSSLSVSGCILGICRDGGAWKRVK
jgi:uncharacterized protein (DUF2147 family)